MRTAAERLRPLPPFAFFLLSALLLFQGVSALLGGYALVADPSGAGLRIPTSWLEATPFNDYLIPGLILFIVLGIFPLVTLAGLLLRSRLASLTWLERVTHEHWSWSASIVTGIALLIWITVQGAMLGFRHPLQVGYLILGVAMIATTLVSPLRRHLALPPTSA